MTYRLSPRLKQYFKDIENERKSDGALFDEFSKKVQGWMYSEFQRAFDHFGLTFDEAKERGQIKVDENGNKVILIDDKPAFKLDAPAVELYESGARVIQSFQRLYELEASE
ncbi:hypothetical protein OIO07_20620 [Bacillus paralicheniformis]|uniref:hypothetical protein n=1 Tax=Bacillus paralicheniformis TaxID=1648923 RepID=UPI000828BD52|nr:hypothetical protein [Bacillus paralicheniformis]AYQ17726.1 hypothetical protein D5285_17510 [Bacillus paralicheniformis]MCV9370634.1 hypothetical protein [Bacillus paralicheniformis]MDI0243679.1 hypothetical protein [Bacillus paralicheniformis]MEC2328828.1 hypothetical protein [Bacillus paralicheniformis]MED0700356.1 hypothetical protein [Bacillus paralicheniformis]